MPATPIKRDSYHHGDLRAALLEAGEAVLSETGVAGFSLRQVARKVGVSHSAPAHHFGDANGLLIALATDGFRRFLTAMQRRRDQAPEEIRERIFASALGYLDFAQSSPALFRLMFNGDVCGPANQTLEQASHASFMHLADDVSALRQKSALEDASVMADVLASWSTVHGYADLLISGRMDTVQGLTPDEQEAFFRQVFMRVIA